MRSPALRCAPPPAIRDEVDRLGRAADEDQLVLGGADEGRDPAPRLLVGERHLGRARIDAAVDGGVVGAERLGDGIDYHLRLLRAGGGVEVVPGPAVGGDQAGEVLAHGMDGSGDIHSITSSRVSAASVRRSSSAEPVKASAMKAWSISRLASGGVSPRDSR